jgi:uncharacterized protein (DUF58 family)
VSKRRRRNAKRPVSSREFIRFRMTESGRLMALGTMAAVMFGSLTLEVPIYHVFTALVVLFVVAAVVGFVYWPRCVVMGGFDGKAVAGESVWGHYTVRNRSKLPAYDVSVGLFDLPREIEVVEHAPTVDRLGAGESARLAMAVRPLRRGLYTLDGLRVYSTFPFNLFRTGPAVNRRESLLVLPRFHPLHTVDVPVGTRYQPGGIALTSHVGESPEYIGNRDYRPGDPFRRIEPRAWARLGTPVVREYQEEYYCRVAVVLDTFVSPRRGRAGSRGFGDLEAGVSLAAAIADAMSRGEYIIDFFAAGPDLYVFRSGRHTALLENMLEILASVDPCRSNPFEKVTPALSEELGTVSAVLLVLLDWDHSRRQLVRAAVEAGCSVRVMVVRDGATTLEVAEDESWTGTIVQLTPEQVSSGKVDQL